MFQVLLVDDEALARHDVKSMLDWEKHGFTICGEAYNGSMALSMMEQHDAAYRDLGCQHADYEWGRAKP
jgi:YesN/AraC family two-component response regulator